jgi:autotransporter-associated beta strand protein
MNMNPKLSLRLLAYAMLLGSNGANAATFTWTNNIGLGDQSWADTANWDAATVFISGSSNELVFLSNSLSLSSGDQNIINVPSALSMNTLTLNGKGRNNPVGATLTIGTNASTWTIGDGTTSTVNLNAIDWSNDRDIRYIVAANLTLNQATTTFTGNGSSARGFIFSGNITDGGSGYGITKSGSSFLTFSGTNTYSGTTLVSGGTLALGNAGALSTASALTLNGGVLELNGFDFNRSLGSGSNQFQITGGNSGFSARGGDVAITVNGDAATELVWGSANFNPSTLVLNRAEYNSESIGNPGYLSTGALTIANNIDLNGATRTIDVKGGTAVLTGDIRSAIGTGGLTKNGSGRLILSGANTYTGATTLTSGVLSVGATDNLGASGAGLVFNGGTLQITGTSLTSITGIGHAVTFTAAKVVGFDIADAANTFTVDQVLNQTTGTLTKSGAGTLVLNQDNTFTGDTTATGGGTLVLDYSTNNGSKLGNTAKLNLNGTNLVLRGGSHAEAVGSIVLLANTGNSISRDGGSTATITGD